MSSTANKAQFVDGSPFAGPCYFVDQNGNPLSIGTIGNVPNLGQATKSASVPVVLPSDQTVLTTSETAQSNTETHNAVSVGVGSVGTLTNAAFSSSINTSDFRKYCMVGVGATDSIQLLLQVSFDGGTTWFWYINGFTSSIQTVMQMGDIVAPLARVAAINLGSAAQNVTAYLCLNR